MADDVFDNLPDLDEASGAFRREEKREKQEDEPTVEVDLGGGRKARFNLPNLPPWMQVAAFLLSGGTGTAFGTVMSQDWLGFKARAEVAALEVQLLKQQHACELAAVRCGCPALEPSPVAAP